MNNSLEKLFDEIRIGSVEQQNDAIGKLTEILRKNYMQGMEHYAYAFLKPSDPMFELGLSTAHKKEIIDEIEKLICSEPDSSSKRASLFGVLGSAYDWQSFELLLKFLQSFSASMSNEEFYQALISFDNLMCLGRDEQPKLISFLATYNARHVVSLHSVDNRIGLPELVASILSQIDQLEQKT